DLDGDVVVVEAVEVRLRGGLQVAAGGAVGADHGQVPPVRAAVVLEVPGADLGAVDVVDLGVPVLAVVRPVGFGERGRRRVAGRFVVDQLGDRVDVDIGGRIRLVRLDVGGGDVRARSDGQLLVGGRVGLVRGGLL